MEIQRQAHQLFEQQTAQASGISTESKFKVIVVRMGSPARKALVIRNQGHTVKDLLTELQIPTQNQEIHIGDRVGVSLEEVLQEGPENQVISVVPKPKNA